MERQDVALDTVCAVSTAFSLPNPQPHLWAAWFPCCPCSGPGHRLTVDSLPCLSSRCPFGRGRCLLVLSQLSGVTCLVNLCWAGRLHKAMHLDDASKPATLNTQSSVHVTPNIWDLRERDKESLRLLQRCHIHTYTTGCDNAQQVAWHSVLQLLVCSFSSVHGSHIISRAETMLLSLAGTA